MAKVGFVGLGIMGRAMLANLVRAGFEVVVWNRSAATPREVVETCDITHHEAGRGRQPGDPRRRRAQPL